MSKGRREGEGQRKGWEEENMQYSNLLHNYICMGCML